MEIKFRHGILTVGNLIAALLIAALISIFLVILHRRVHTPPPAGKVLLTAVQLTFVADDFADRGIISPDGGECLVNESYEIVSTARVWYSDMVRIELDARNTNTVRIFEALNTDQARYEFTPAPNTLLLADKDLAFRFCENNEVNPPVRYFIKVGTKQNLPDLTTGFSTSITVAPKTLLTEIFFTDSCKEQVIWNSDPGVVKNATWFIPSKQSSNSLSGDLTWPGHSTNINIIWHETWAEIHLTSGVDKTTTIQKNIGRRPILVLAMKGSETLLIKRLQDGFSWSLVPEC